MRSGQVAGVNFRSAWLQGPYWSRPAGRLMDVQLGIDGYRGRAHLIAANGRGPVANGERAWRMYARNGKELLAPLFGPIGDIPHRRGLQVGGPVRSSGPVAPVPPPSSPFAT